MACGSCGGVPVNAVNLTSSELAAQTGDPVAPGMATFKVLGANFDNDPEDVTYWSTYRAARIYQANNGGTLRAV
jgi:hypothetical protein